MKPTEVASVLMAIALTLVCVGCNHESVAMDASRVDRLVLTYPKGGTVVTNGQMIADLAETMKCAKVDHTLYDTAMTLKIEFFADDTNLATFAAGGNLFRDGKTQYHDRTGKFQEAIRKLTERTKAPIGIGTPLAERPSHTTNRTDRVISGSAAY